MLAAWPAAISSVEICTAYQHRRAQAFCLKTQNQNQEDLTKAMVLQSFHHFLLLFHHKVIHTKRSEQRCIAHTLTALAQTLHKQADCKADLLVYQLVAVNAALYVAKQY